MMSHEATLSAGAQQMGDLVLGIAADLAGRGVSMAADATVGAADAVGNGLANLADRAGSLSDSFTPQGRAVSADSTPAMAQNISIDAPSTPMQPDMASLASGISIQGIWDGVERNQTGINTGDALMTNMTMDKALERAQQQFALAA